MSARPYIADAVERVRALDPEESFLVQAPAGSGKTELLTLRYLALLPTVEQPEEVLAITFTRKATAEMRSRVLQALENARSAEYPEASEHQLEVRRLARVALDHATALGWQILEQPQRLNIQTIDSLALSIAYQTPLLSRLGGLLTPVDEAGPLYALAAERVLAHLGSAEEPELAAALHTILSLRDASLPDCESLIAGMLARRDQWLLMLPEIGQGAPAWEALRTTLEAPFRREHMEVIAQLSERFASGTALETLLPLAAMACDNGNEGLAPLRGIQTSSELTELSHWQAVSHFLITGKKWRSRYAKQEGFPADTHRHEGSQARAIVSSLSSDDALLSLLCRAASLPPCAYTGEEWRLVQSIFIVLRRATAELRVVFAEQAVIDFAEAGLSAHSALKDPGVLMRQDETFRHILVDEFQDTSRTHFVLLRTLLQEWQPGAGRSCFFVGDPMQSIYLFRDAEAQLFEQVRSHGLQVDGVHHALTTLQLSTNFRSAPAIVEPLNDIFTQVLNGGHEDSVPYAPSVSSKPAPGGDAISMHVQLCENGDASSEDAIGQEAESIVAVIRSHLPAIEQAKQSGGKYRVAVLGRTRAHLAETIDRLRRENISFRGVKIDLLRDRPEILDLLSLLRALLHPTDRIAWLAVLRAPWCGLTIPALHAICGDPADAELRGPIASLLLQNAGRLDADNRQRAIHVLSILNRAQEAYADGVLATSPASLALWLERTWHALGAPRYLSAESLANATSFFAALAQMAPYCFGTLDESLNQRLEDLHAEPDPSATEDCGVQLMTIHSAKGLEFEVVLVPQLHRLGKRDDPPLFHWLVRRRDGTTDDELLLAPIGRKHGEAPALFEWVGKRASERLRDEEKRLLYVACSRAIRELHLFAAVERKRDGELAKPIAGSLLRAGWDGLKSRIEKALKASPARSKVYVIPTAVPPAARRSKEHTLSSLAASAAPAQTLRRLPSEWFHAAVDTHDIRSEHPSPVSDQHPGRIAGNRLARVQGIVLHTLLEHATGGGREVASTDGAWARLAELLIRQHALSPAEAALAQTTVLRAVRRVLEDENGRWLLSAREAAYSEQSWNSIASNRVLRQRPDRVFLAGEHPGAPGTDYLWLIDYKTAAPPDGDDRECFLTASRDQYRDQLEAYSQLFRKLAAGDAAAIHREHRLALYHPMLPWLDWWPA